MRGRLASATAILVVIVAGWSSALGSEAAVALYNEGNARYRAGDYAGAIDRYESALTTGLRNARLYYNLGNAHYKQGNLGRARLNYERALRLAPADADVIANIEVLEAMSVDRFESDPPNAVTRFLAGVYSGLTPGRLAVALTVGIFLACAAGGCLIFRTTQRLRWSAILGVGLVVCISSAALLAARAADLRAEAAVILAAETDGRSGPGDDFLKVFVLHEGTRVAVERREGDWVLVRLPNGIGGWLRADALARI